MLAYEVTRIRSYDVALASWTVALTGGAITALDSDGGLVSSVVGFVPRRLAEWLQVWALRDQGTERDRAHPDRGLRPLEAALHFAMLQACHNW